MFFTPALIMCKISMMRRSIKIYFSGVEGGGGGGLDQQFCFSRQGRVVKCLLKLPGGGVTPGLG